MVDQAFHVALHLAAPGRGQLAARQDVALPGRFAQLVDRLPHDADRLAHLFHADQITVIAIAILADRDVKVEFVIAFVGLRPPQIPGHPRTAHHHAGIAPVQHVLFMDDADIDIALLEDPVLGQQPVKIVHDLQERIAPGLDIVDQVGRQILMHATGAEIGRVQAGSAGALVEHHQLFAFLEAPQGRGQRAHVHGLRGHVQQMAENAADLGIQHPDQAGAARNLDTRQPFDGHAPGMFLIHRRDVIQPVQIGQVLQIGAAFHQLLGAAMQQPDMRVTAFDHLPVQLQHQPQDAMRGRVLRAEVDVEVADALFAGQRVGRTVVIDIVADIAVHHFAPCFSSPGRTYFAPSQGDRKSNWRYSWVRFTGS